MNILKVGLIAISMAFSPVVLAKPKPLSLAMLQQQETANVEGILYTLCSMPKKSTDEPVYLYHLKTADGNYTQVFFPKDYKIPESGSKVIIKRAFMLGSLKGIYATGDLQTLEAPSFKYDGLGEKKVLVGLINYSDKPTANTATIASYTSLYNTVKTGFWSQSFNNITINSTILDKIILTSKSTDACDGTFLYSSMDQLKAAATARGVDPTQYAHFQLILPSTAGCGWCGLGSVGGPYTWINACNSYSTVGHELGHNIGLMHSNSYTGCDANWKNCTNNEYADGASLQGVAEGEFTAVHKQKLKWLDNASSNPRSQLVTESGSYFIEPLETLTTGVKTIKFLRASGEYYYVEFRQPLNYDTRINTSYHKSLGIHYLADNSTASWRLKNVGIGGSFVDPGFPGGGLTISLISYSANGANVNVQIGGVPPVTPTPTVVPTIVPTKTPTVVPTIVPTKTPTVTPTINPTVTPTVTPGSVVFKVVPGQPSYNYDPTRTIWSSVSVWIQNNNKPVINAPTNYRVYNQNNKMIRELNKNTDSNGYIKFGLPIDASTTPGTYKVIITSTISAKKYVSEPTYFVIK